MMLIFVSVVGNGCIFRKDGDTAFALNGIGVHDAFCHFLIGTEHTALFQTAHQPAWFCHDLHER